VSYQEFVLLRRRSLQSPRFGAPRHAGPVDERDWDEYDEVRMWARKPHRDAYRCAARAAITTRAGAASVVGLGREDDLQQAQG
jgi:hypothetical protein